MTLGGLELEVLIFVIVLGLGALKLFDMFIDKIKAK